MQYYYELMRKTAKRQFEENRISNLKFEYQRNIIPHVEDNDDTFFNNYFLPMSFNDYYLIKHVEDNDDTFFNNYFLPMTVNDYYFNYFHDEHQEEDEEFEEPIDMLDEFYSGNPNINFIVDAYVEVSFGIKHIIIPESAGIHSEEDAINYIHNIFPGANIVELIPRNYSNIVLPSSTTNILKFAEMDENDIEEQLAEYFADLDVNAVDLHASPEMNCVTNFKRKFKNLTQTYYDGMTQEEFLKKARIDNIAVYNNQMFEMTYNNNAKNHVICYNGHILESNELINTTFNEIVELDINSFYSNFNEIIQNKENIVYDIKVYDGIYGKYLTQFCFNHKCYKLNYHNPMQEFLNPLNDNYACNFVHPAVSNCAVYSGEGNEYGYDLNAAYINALKSVTKIPIIDNIPITKDYYNKHFSNYDAVVLVENKIEATDTEIGTKAGFKYHGINFPPTLWYKSIADQYYMHYDKIYLITEWKEFNFDNFSSLISIPGQMPTNKIFQWHDIQYKSKDKYKEAVIRYALGAMITTIHNNKFKNVYTSYLDDILNDDLPHKYSIPNEVNSIKLSSLHNVYHAMKMEYYKQILELIDAFHPSGIFCDCIYVNDEISSDDCLKYNLKLESKNKFRNCNKTYTSDISTSNIKLINGLAGYGKSYSVKNDIDVKLHKDDYIVIVPELRLRTVWEGFNVYSLQHILNSHKFPNKNLIVDECYKFSTDSINYLIGYANMHQLTLFLIGDSFQLQQVIPIINGENIEEYVKRKNLAFRIYGMKPSIKLTKNYRNNINYMPILKSGKDENKRKELFQQYLSNNLVNINDFTDVNYCFRTNGENNTTSIADQKYQEYVSTLPSDATVNIKCIKNYKNKQQKQFYNGLIYQIKKSELAYYPKTYFTISNTYSIYATQGQSIESSKLRLIKDDEKYYYNNFRILYVLISRLSH